MCGDPQALIWAKKIGFGAFLGSQSCQILKITVFANLEKKRLSNLLLFNFEQLLFYDLPQKNASKYPKIAIFRFANTVIFKIGQL